MKRYLLLSSGLAFLALFSELGEYAKARPLAVDRDVALWFKAHRTPREVQWAQVLSALTTPIIVLAAIMMLLLYLNYLARSWYLRDFIPSYPSSHLLYMAAAVSSLFLAARNSRFWIFIPVLLLSSVIGLSRLVLGVHWFTDSVGAVFLAVGMWIIFFVLDDWIAERERERA